MPDIIAVPDVRSDWDKSLGELETLIAFLDYYRETVLTKLDGLTRAQVAQRVVGSRTTLMGIVKHLTLVEEWWFQADFAGEPRDEPPADEDPDVEWLIDDRDDPVQAIAEYRAAYARSDEIARAAASLDEHARRPNRTQFSLRWILVHMVEETARHAGHADIIRELIDNRTGD